MKPPEIGESVVVLGRIGHDLGPVTGVVKLPGPERTYVLLDCGCCRASFGNTQLQENGG